MDPTIGTLSICLENIVSLFPYTELCHCQQIFCLPDMSGSAANGIQDQQALKHQQLNSFAGQYNFPRLILLTLGLVSNFPGHSL